MKKQCLPLFVMLLLATPTMAQRVMIDNFDELKVNYVTPVVTVTEGDYLLLNAAGYVSGGEVGAPALPVCNSLLMVPFCEGISVEVSNAIFDTLILPAGRVMPLQPSRSKSDRSTPTIVVDEQVYATDAYFGRPLASVEYLGTGRDRNYALLTWSPVSVNPVSGTMVVCRRADVTVRYKGSDAGATMKHYERYHTPAFSLGRTLNTLYASTKDVCMSAPVRMVIMAPQSLQCAALDEFVTWKRQQGMMVDLNYMAADVTSTTIAAQLQQMYDEASDVAPAPTFLVIVGDNNVMPVFSSRINYSTLNDHITDLYYVTWTSGDNLPDCYQGRLSARDTSTLRSIIEKTLYYEQYKFANDSYLAKAALIAGVDQTYYVDTTDNAYRYADPTMDYVAYYYVNNENGYSDIYYYKNNTSYAPEGVTVTGDSRSTANASALRSRYNSGVGWINYSAHGNWDNWTMPSFTVTHVGNMTNANKPSFMIGNCCLSNKFDKPECLGEALLRKGGNAGAVAYIGGTNSTMWTHDFYWSIGVRSNIYNRMTPSYSASQRGVYDNLFHTHGESLESQMVTAGQIVVSGNMSVNSAGGSSWSSLYAQYYWEIYELMGDPSLLPWLGTADDLLVTATHQVGDDLVVTAVPGAYVALLHGDSNELVSTAFAGTDGMAQLAVPVAHLDSTYSISITAQGYKPYLRSCTSDNVGLHETATADVVVSPNPASVATEVRAEGLHHVELLNVMGQILQTVAASGDHCTVNLTALPSGLYLLRIETASGAVVRKLVKQ